MIAVPPIPDDAQIPAEAMALAMRMARHRRSNQDISDATGISLARVARMQITGSLTYTGKREGKSRPWRGRR